MKPSIKKQYSVCLLWRFLIKLGNYEPGLVNLVLHFMTTITLKTNEELQLKINKYFENIGEGTEKFGCLSKWNVFAIKQIDIVLPRNYCCMKCYNIKNWISQKNSIIIYNNICYKYCMYYPWKIKNNMYNPWKIRTNLCKQEYIKSYDYVSYLDNTDSNISYLDNEWNFDVVYIDKKTIKIQNFYFWNFSDINKLPKCINKKLKYQRDRNTRYINKTSPKIKSSKIQIGKQ